MRPEKREGESDEDAVNAEIFMPHRRKSKSECKRTDFSGAQTILFFQLALTSAIKLFMRPTTRLSILGLTLVSLVTAWPAQAATYEWLTDSDGSWSVATNWLNGIAPPAGGASDAILVFDSSDFGADATNDLPGVFSLNQMIFDHDGTDILTVKSNSGSSLSFTRTNPVITGTASVRMLSPME